MLDGAFALVHHEQIMATDPLRELEETLTQTLEKCYADLGATTTAVSFVRSKDAGQGDIATAAPFAVGKMLKMAPLQAAEAGATAILALKDARVATAEAALPGFINVTLSATFLSSLLETIRADNTYGESATLKGETWAIEHTSPNPNKAMHLGHLRNNLVGMSAVRILKASGANVISDWVDNNRGIAIAKLMWGFLAHKKKNTDAPTDITYWFAHQDEWQTPEGAGQLPDVFVGECYVAGDTDAKDPEIEARVRDMVVSWEAKDEMVWALWKHVLSYSYAGMERTLARLGNHWDHAWHEHEHYEEGKRFVDEGLAKGIFKKLEDGAVLTDLAAYDIPDTILLKRDGTSLYITQDLALTALKKEKYHADRLVWVIGPDQTLALRQLFAVCEQLGIGKVRDFTHVSYGYVALADGEGGRKKMSSREGTVVLIDDVIDTVKQALMERSTDEGRELLGATAERLALAAVKWSVLRADRTQDLIFDVDRSIELKGDSGIYLLYTYVRARSILRKAEGASVGGGTLEGVSEKALGLLRLLAHYPYIISRAREELSVHHVAQYLLEIASVFNTWYAEEQMLAEDASRSERLAIIEAFTNIVAHGLALMGIETVEEM